MGMTIDMSDFEKGFKKLVENSIPPETEKGLVKAANALLTDAIEEAPQAPKKTGALWRSKHVNAVVVTQDDVSIEAGFNIIYAARWHEAEAGINWTTNKGATNPGPKYLESKMARNAKRYLDIVGEYLKGLLGG
jgi:hypothetical protein